MPSIRTEPDSVAWTPWTEVFGDGAFYEGRPIIETKTLSDRRNEGGGIAYLLRFRPPEGKLIKIVAVARSDASSRETTGRRTAAPCADGLKSASLMAGRSALHR